MKIARFIYLIGYGAVTLLFFCSALSLIYFAGLTLIESLTGGTMPKQARFNAALEAIGLLTIAVVALELSQTILEEEIRRQANVSAPTRVRRFLSRFMIVVVIALSIESLVGVFHFVHEDPSKLPHAAAVAVGAAALLLAWGVFIRMNRSAEELEPEAMERAKQEDEKVE